MLKRWFLEGSKMRQQKCLKVPKPAENGTAINDARRGYRQTRWYCFKIHGGTSALLLDQAAVLWRQ